MGRKLFGAMLPDPDKRLEPPAAPSPAAETTQDLGAVRSRARSAQSLRGGLLELTANSIRELDPAVILADGPMDRLGVDHEAISALAESIRVHGQQVPILVRPADTPDRFRIVYGRRRLAAVRSLGAEFRVKAIVRTLEDDAAVIAQGQENNLRIDPSFIEKAVFVGALRNSGFSSQVIQDALGVDRTVVSKLATVVENIPEQVIMAIGAAPEIGRRPWTELAHLARDEGIDLVSLLPIMKANAGDNATGTQRFEIVLGLAKAALASAANDAAVQHERKLKGTSSHRAHGHDGLIRRIHLAGKPAGSMKKSRRSLSLNVSLRHQPEFGQWLEEHVDEAFQMLHDRWKKSQGGG